MKHVGIWIRVSTEMQAQGDSPEHHELRARQYAEFKQWKVVEVYNLAGVSGKSVIEHQEAKRMMRDIASGKITGLIFSKIARLARNLKELISFSEYFQEHKADLISLDEQIDTSTPAGRLSYNLISSMAAWEREEISARVKASVPIRAKLGKSLGGAAPYGYCKNPEGKLVLNEEEAPIRKLMFDLFAQHQRKRIVARLLNEKGYRTRKGANWSDTSVDRLLRDPIAKGLRRANYTQSRGEGKSWDVKDESQWVFTKAPRIVSDELWSRCNEILDAMRSSRTKVRKQGKYLFAGLVHCECGHKMYSRGPRSAKYSCRNCTNKIEPDVLETVFLQEFEAFLNSDEEIQRQISNQSQIAKDKERQIVVLQKSVQSLNLKIDKVMELFHSDKITADAFEKYHTPLYDEMRDKEAEILNLDAEVSSSNFATLSNAEVIKHAKTFIASWPQFDQETKRTIAHQFIHRIEVSKNEIAIDLNYIPTHNSQYQQLMNGEAHSQTDGIMQRNGRDSSMRPT